MEYMKQVILTKPKGTFYTDFAIRDNILYCIFEKLDDRVVTKKVGRLKHNYISDFIETPKTVTLKYT